MSDQLVAQTVSDDTGTRVHLIGEIDATTLRDVRQAVRPHLQPNATVIVDLAGVWYISVAGARLLSQLRADLAADGGRLVFWRPRPACEQALRRAQPDNATGIHHGPLGDLPQ